MFKSIKNLFVKNDDKLIKEFIMHMKQYNINLKKKSDGLLMCMDFPFRNETDYIEYMVRNGKIVVDYTKNSVYVLRTFFPYYRVIYNFENESPEKSIENLYTKIVDGLDFENDKHGEIYFKTYLQESMERLPTYLKYSSKNYLNINEWSLPDLFSKFFFPSITFKNGKLTKNLVLLFCLKESPYEHLYGTFKDVIINIEELKDTFELKIYCHTYGLEIDSISIKKDIPIEQLVKRILIVIKSLSIDKKNYDMLGISDWKEFTEDHYETLKLLTY